MDSKQERVSQLIQQYLANKLTAEEYREMWQLLNESSEESDLQL